MLFKTSLTKELFYTSLSTILILSGVVIAQRSVYIFRLAAKGIIPNDAIDTILVFNLLKHLPLLLSLTLFLTILIQRLNFLLPKSPCSRDAHEFLKRTFSNLPTSTLANWKTCF